MKVEIKLVDGTEITGDNFFFNAFNQAFINDKVNYSSILSVTDINTKRNVVYISPLN